MKKKWFTLVEVVVTSIILAIISAGVVWIIQAFENANKEVGLSFEIQQIQDSILNILYTDNENIKSNLEWNTFDFKEQAKSEFLNKYFSTFSWSKECYTIDYNAWNLSFASIWGWIEFDIWEESRFDLKLRDYDNSTEWDVYHTILCVEDAFIYVDSLESTKEFDGWPVLLTMYSTYWDNSSIEQINTERVLYFDEK